MDLFIRTLENSSSKVDEQQMTAGIPKKVMAWKGEGEREGESPDEEIVYAETNASWPQSEPGKGSLGYKRKL